MIKYMYWIPADDFGAVSPALRAMGVRLSGSKMTPCETLKMTANKAVYATATGLQPHVRAPGLVVPRLRAQRKIPAADAGETPCRVRGPS